jgi:hypothetical protein
MHSDSPHHTVKEALKDFYARHNYGDEGGINERYAWIKFGFFSIPIINLEGRRRNVYLHDINHIITGYDTSWKGESSVSAWEIASGGWKKIYIIWVMALWAMGLGMIFYPVSTLRSFKNGMTMTNALTCNISKSEMLLMAVPELRNKMSNKPATNKSPLLWTIVSLVFFILPNLNILFGCYLLFRVLW